MLKIRLGVSIFKMIIIALNIHFKFLLLKKISNYQEQWQKTIQLGEK